jgi:hypothetical protein
MRRPSIPRLCSPTGVAPDLTNVPLSDWRARPEPHNPKFVLVCADDENNRVCLLSVLCRSADRHFASSRCAPFDGVVRAGYLANLDWCFGLVLRLVFAASAWLARMMDFALPQSLRSKSGSLAMFAAIRLASSLVRAWLLIEGRRNRNKRNRVLAAAVLHNEGCVQFFGCPWWREARRLQSP